MRVSKENTPEKLAASINKVLARIGVEYIGRVGFRAYTTEFPKFIANPLPSPVTDMQLTHLRNLTDDVAPAAGVFVDWIPDPNGIRIRGVTGLTSGKNYEFRFIIYA